MTILNRYSTSAMFLTVKREVACEGHYVCVTDGGEELKVDLHAGATTKPLDLKNIIGKRIWVEWLQPYNWIAESPVIAEEEK